jgi:hypothetical protein
MSFQKSFTKEEDNGSPTSQFSFQKSLEAAADAAATEFCKLTVASFRNEPLMIT